MTVRYIIGSLLLFAAVSGVTAAGGSCPQTFCPTPCPYGFTSGATGCPTCSCNQRKGIQLPACLDVRCFVPCSSGYTKDDAGCLTCTCAPESAVRATTNKIHADSGSCTDTWCFMPCPQGYQLDSNGCPTCDCVTSSRPSSEALKKLAAAEFKKKMEKLIH